MLALGAGLVDRGPRPLLLLLAAHLLGLYDVLLTGRVEHHVLKDWTTTRGMLTQSAREAPAERGPRSHPGHAPLELTVAPHMRQSTLVPECVGSSMIVPQYSQNTTLPSMATSILARCFFP